MNDMTLDEAIRRLERLTLCPVESDDGDIAAIRVILAALPTPAKPTPGQALWDADQNFGPNQSGVKARPFKECADPARWEHGALAVLKAHAVDFALADEAIRFITNGYRLHTFDAIRAAVQARLDNDGDDRIRSGRTDRT